MNKILQMGMIRALGWPFGIENTVFAHDKSKAVFAHDNQSFLIRSRFRVAKNAANVDDIIRFNIGRR